MRQPWIWLQDWESDARLNCGCRLIASYKGSGPAIFLCKRHEAAANKVVSTYETTVKCCDCDEGARKSRIGYVAARDAMSGLLGSHQVFGSRTLVLGQIYTKPHRDWVKPQVKKVRVTVEEV